MSKPLHIGHPAIAPFWAYWKRHYPRLGAPQWEWLAGCVEIRSSVKQGSQLFQPGDRPDYLYFINDGLLAGIWWDADGHRRIPCLIPAGHSLLTSCNLYTSKQLDYGLKALRRSQILRIPSLALKRYREIDAAGNELVHVLREKQIKELRAQNKLLQIADTHKRYLQFQQSMPALWRITSQQEQADFLNLSRPSIARYLREL
ncbi:Crp/Fnr family transcriptional regulator [Parapedobacter lycopersici]|uniref:Crp/Fnr family transcriptional regulator n=1 Tax=Parapedobacter lycopersici TaxID=1864939 RepID=UPI00214D4E0E|nr:hypothetical protein [Parapedobacter lycopersici]